MKVIKLSALLLFTACASPERVVDRIHDPMEKRQEKYRQCYLESDSYPRDLKTEEKRTITVSFTVLPEGKVKEEKIVRSDFKDANLHQCILWLTRETKFSPGPDATAVQVFHPIDFRSRNL
jgi:hypothetical protein